MIGEKKVLTSYGSSILKWSSGFAYQVGKSLGIVSVANTNGGRRSQLVGEIWKLF
jgi:hypothetical protein